MLESDVEAINFKIGCRMAIIKGEAFNQVNTVLMYNAFIIMVQIMKK